MTRKQKRNLKRIVASSALFVLCLFIPSDGTVGVFGAEILWKYVRGVLFLAPYIVVGYDVLRKAFLNIIHGQLFDENFLMALATIGALAIGEYPEAVFVMLFYQVGELFQSIAVGKSRRSITELMDICPEFARVERGGEYVEVSPEEAKVGEKILIKPGERVPLDGKIIKGLGSMDTSALTGESMPRDISEGDDVISGCISLTGLFEVEVKKEYGESTVAKILEMVETSSMRKAKTENFITRFARVYTPAVVVTALIVAFLPQLVLFFLGQSEAAFSTMWLSKALSFLVVSCPCALVISVPLSFFGGIGGASAKGILIKGSSYLEALSDAEICVFDKTGTLTKGEFEVTEPVCDGDKKELLRIAAQAEAHSNHPIAQSIRRACGEEIDPSAVTDVTEVPGRGIKADVDGKITLAGNIALMKENNIKCDKLDKNGSIVYVAQNGQYLGAVVIADTLKDNAREMMAELTRLGVKQTIMLTGDTEKAAKYAADELGLDKVYHSLLPGDKVKKLEEILSEKKRGSVVYTGDGVNDAPVLKLADVGIAMGAMGSDAAIEAADIVLMDDDAAKLPLAIRIAKKTMRIVKENIVFSLVVKIGVLLLTLFGMANMWQAVFADVGVMVIAVINAMRALK